MNIGIKECSFIWKNQGGVDYLPRLMWKNERCCTFVDIATRPALQHLSSTKKIHYLKWKEDLKLHKIIYYCVHCLHTKW